MGFKFGLLRVMSNQNNRREKRRRVLKGARIMVPALGLSLDCAIRDLSEAGACLVLTTPAVIPDTFELAMYESGIKQCRIVWRAANKIGVSFEAGLLDLTISSPSDANAS